MSINLPETIDAYFAADSNDSKDIAECFTEDAVVIDEKNTYKGQAAIRQWKTETSNKFTYKSEPYSCEVADGKTVVTSKLTGNFPGSPISLRYFFGLEGDRIAFLEIKP